jgi:hypothetical protein
MHAEEYLLWVFGREMYHKVHENSVEKTLLPYAAAIADAKEVKCWGGAGARWS